MIRRDTWGRVVGSGFAFQNFEEEESWRDRKIKAADIIFPNHKDNGKIGKVDTYRIGSDGELIKVN